MILNEKISNDIKDAMRAKDTEKLSVLRMLKAALMNKIISMREGGAAELTDEQIQEVVASEVKKRRDSATEYRTASRPELAEKEEYEVGILEGYLPVQMTDEDLEAGIKAIIDSAEKKDYGLLMKEAITKYKGQADGRRIGEMIKKILG